MDKNKKLKILLVGHEDPWTIFNSYVNKYKALGHKIEIVNVRTAYSISFLNRLLNAALARLGIVPVYFGTDRINEMVLEKAEKLRPDLVVFYNSVYIAKNTVEKLKSYYKSVVFCWTTDATFYNRNISRPLLKTIPLFDCHFTINSSTVPDLKEKGARRVILTPPAADRSIHYPVEVSEEERKRLGADLVFVGTYADDKRAEYSERLCRDGYDIKVYGTGWEKDVKCRCLKKNSRLVYGVVHSEEMSKVFNAGKIVLSFLRAHNKDKQTTRTYEIPACGAFMLHERNDEVVAIFKEGEEAEFFDSYEELKKKVDYYLSHPEERKIIAKNGYERIKKYDCTYEARVETILNVYYEIKK